MCITVALHSYKRAPGPSAVSVVCFSLLIVYKEPSQHYKLISRVSQDSFCLWESFTCEKCQAWVFQG